MENYFLRMSMLLLRSFGIYAYLFFSLAFYVLHFIPILIFLIYNEYKCCEMLLLSLLN